jgi:hypothetical protein
MTSLNIGQTDKFSMSFYIQTVFGILGRPRKFFSELSPAIGMRPSLVFLSVSALFFCIASLTNMRPNAFYIMGVIHLFNAVGMVFIMAGLGYLVMMLSIGRKVTFDSFFSVYALCSGVVLLVSWVPYAAILTEPWKWYLIGSGLTAYCGLRLRDAVFIIVLSLAVWILFYWSLMPLIRQ